MDKKTIKHIREIADRLPNVYEQCASGGEVGLNDNGEKVFIPNVYNMPVNHVRRLRKAYEQLGMDGIRNYLEMIHKLQIQRNETVKEDIASGRTTPEGARAPESTSPVSENLG